MYGQFVLTTPAYITIQRLLQQYLIVSTDTSPTQNPSTDTLTSTTIEWSVAGDSVADISSYTITYTSESGEGVESVDGSATSCSSTNVDYEASITASNCAGTSEPTSGLWEQVCVM